MNFFSKQDLFATNVSANWNLKQKVKVGTSVGGIASILIKTIFMIFVVTRMMSLISGDKDIPKTILK